jgi:hypothetical protein
VCTEIQFDPWCGAAKDGTAAPAARCVSIDRKEDNRDDRDASVYFECGIESKLSVRAPAAEEAVVCGQGLAVASVEANAELRDWMDVADMRQRTAREHADISLSRPNATAFDPGLGRQRRHRRNQTIEPILCVRQRAPSVGHPPKSVASRQRGRFLF